MDWCHTKKRRANTLLILSTLGGDPSTAYRISRCIQATCPDGGLFLVAVPGKCKSAGTLLAIGAHCIFMNHLAELGPLDVQIMARDELGEFQSGLIPSQAMETLGSETQRLFERTFLDLRYKSGMQISTRLAADIATELATGVMSKIYAMVDPMQLGGINRSMKIGLHYGLRLKEVSGNLKKGALETLTLDYPDHGFVIDKQEARELFKNILDFPPFLSDLVLQLQTSLRHGIKRFDGKEPVIEFLTDTIETDDIQEKTGEKNEEPTRPECNPTAEDQEDRGNPPKDDDPGD